MTDIASSNPMRSAPQLSVLITSDQKDGAADMLAGYRTHLDALDRNYEVLAVVNGAHTRQCSELEALAADWPALTVIGQTPWVGEDAALATGLRRSQGALILLLPGWPQIDPADMPALFEKIEQHDMVSAVRTTGNSSGWQGFRRTVFSRTLDRLFGIAPSDPFCRARLVRREVLESTVSFGVRQHFLPIIASQRGHDVAEAKVAPAPEAAAGEARYVFKPLGHMRAFLDALALFVVLKFLRRPLRFFGAVGLPIFLIGLIMTLVLVVGRIMGDFALSDRPALIFAVMMVVLGIQILAIGLVGEIIIFAGARRMKQYDVAEIITAGREPAATEDHAPDPAPTAPRLRNVKG